MGVYSANVGIKCFIVILGQALQLRVAIKLDILYCGYFSLNCPTIATNCSLQLARLRVLSMVFSPFSVN